MINAVPSPRVTIPAKQAAKMSSADANKLVKYANNEALREIPDSFGSELKSTAGFAAVFEGIPFLKFVSRIHKNKAGYNNVVKPVLDNSLKGAKDSFKNLFKKGSKVSDKVGDYLLNANKVKEEYSASKSLMKALNKEAKLTEKIAKKAAKGKDVTKLTGKLTKTQEAIKGATKVGTEAATKSGGKFGKLLKSSGAKGMLVLSGLIECFTEVVPTFRELGFKSGVKQLGKSAVKVVGDTAGFIAGEYAGTAVGAAIGTAICPVVGTAIGGAIGAVCGFLGGCLGSAAMRKVTSGITGKSEREIAQDKADAELAKQVSEDAESEEALKIKALERIQAEMEAGQLSDDSKEMLNILDINPAQPSVA